MHEKKDSTRLTTGLRPTEALVRCCQTDGGIDKGDYLEAQAGDSNSSITVSSGMIPIKPRKQGSNKRSYECAAIAWRCWPEKST